MKDTRHTLANLSRFFGELPLTFVYDGTISVSYNGILYDYNYDRMYLQSGKDGGIVDVSCALLLPDTSNPVHTPFEPIFNIFLDGGDWLAALYKATVPARGWYDIREGESVDEWIVKLGEWIGNDEISVTSLVIQDGKLESFTFKEFE